MGRFGQAADHFERALNLHEQTDDLTGQARTLTNLGIVEARLSRYRRVADHHEQALTRYQKAGDRTGEASMLGDVEVRLGRYDLAAKHIQQAMTLYRQRGHEPAGADHRRPGRQRSLGAAELDRIGVRARLGRRGAGEIRHQLSAANTDVTADGPGTSAGGRIA
jgi:tetratricopeptide (TPR) repeat protein